MGPRYNVRLVMMKSLIRWSATLSLLGSTLLGTWSAQMPKVLALPEAEVIELLQGVPVFTITTEDGGPLIVNLEDQKVTQVFMSQEDANRFLAQLQKKSARNRQQSQGTTSFFGRNLSFCFGQQYRNRVLEICLYSYAKRSGIG